MLWKLAVLAGLALAGGCTPPPAPAQHSVTAEQDNAWVADTALATSPAHLYVLTVASQLMGMETIDSVTHWGTAGGALRVDRWGKPGPLVRTGDWKIVDIQERH